jgi:hypothetical protein
MSDDAIIPVAPKDLTECKALASDLALSSVIPMALRRKKEDVLAVVLAGAELGLPPMQSIRGLNLINGKISMSAELMGALVRNSKQCEFLRLSSSSATTATWETRRKGSTVTQVHTWTIEQAQKAGIVKGDNWTKYPEAMLRARALSGICKIEYQDVLMGCYESESGELEETSSQTPDSKQAEHAATVAAKLREVVEGEIVSSTPPPKPSTESSTTHAPIPVSVTPELSAVELLTFKMGQSKTLADLTGLLTDIQKLSTDEKQILRPIFLARKEVLK